MFDGPYLVVSLHETKARVYAAGLSIDAASHYCGKVNKTARRAGLTSGDLAKVVHESAFNDSEEQTK